MKKKIIDFTDNERSATINAFFSAVTATGGTKETKKLLEDLLTESEQIMLGRRIIIARMLLMGLSYEEIRLRLNVGPDTISRVQGWLTEQFPDMRDIQLASRNKVGDKDNSLGTLGYLKKKYPLHFLLFNIADEIGKYRTERKTREKRILRK